MKKLLLLFISFCSIQFTIGQYGIDFENYCSKARFFEANYHQSKEIIQTPLLNDYDVKFYNLNLKVETTSVSLSGSVSAIAQVVAEELDTFSFELIDQLTIDSVFIDGIKHGYFRDNNEVFVSLSNTIGQGSQFQSQVYYHGTPPTGEFFSGISSVYDSAWDQRVTWTLSEPFNAREWWPTKQVLTDKIDSVWIFLTTSHENKAGSNGLLTNVVNLPDNNVRYEWKSRYPIDYYLISFAVADYQEYNIYAHPDGLGGDSIFIQNYLYDTPGCLGYYKQGMDNTVAFLELFSDLYSMYPFHKEKYGHCLTALSGGMEHQTMTTLGGFGFGLVAHELGHMWFGDNVTCATWSDIWINEGFATYSDYLVHEMIAGGEWPHIWLSMVHNHVLQAPEGSIYVPPDEVQYDNVLRIFDSKLSYHKGAVMIHMIRYQIQDDDLFFKVLKNFQIQFADSVATGLDFMQVLNETTGMDFTEFFNQWYFGEGYPVYYFNWVQNDQDLTFESTQTTTVPQATPLFKMPLPCRLYFSDGSDSTLVFEQTENEMIFTVPLEKQIDSIAIDPDLWVLKKVAYLNNINSNEIFKHVRIYPNPVKDKIIIENLTTEILDLEMTSLNGKLMINQKIIQPKTAFDIYDYKPGIYFLRLKLANKSGLLKIIKL